MGTKLEAKIGQKAYSINTSGAITTAEHGTVVKITPAGKIDFEETDRKVVERFSPEGHRSTGRTRQTQFYKLILDTDPEYWKIAQRIERRRSYFEAIDAIEKLQTLFKERHGKMPNLYFVSLKNEIETLCRQIEVHFPKDQ